jgi:predicted ATP-grasp superfamily ATP-dependent carboligase
VVGASARAAAFSAIRAGFKPAVGDLFADWDLARRCHAQRVPDYPSGLAALLAGRPDDPWMYTGALENHPGLLNRLAKQARLWGNSGEVVRQVRRPLYLASVLGSAGIDFAETRLLRQGAPEDGTWLVKAYRSSGGRQVAPWQGPASMEGRRRTTSEAYLQRRQQGRACGAVYVAAGGRARLLGVTRQLIGRKWCGTAGFHYSGSVGPIRLDRPEQAAFRRIGQILAAQFGLVGLFGVDAVVSSGRVWVVEVNPRYTASVEVIEWATGIRAIALHAQACRHGVLTETASDADGRGADLVCGKAVLFAEHDTTVASDGRFHRLGRRAGYRWPRFADIPAPAERIGRGRPAATALACGTKVSAVVRHLRRRLDMLRRGLFIRG